jgi:proteasome lid subunit RPN8/RPN11
MLLVLIGTTLQVAHSHPDNLSHADCALCATAHVVAHVVATQAPPAVVLVAGAVHRFVPLPAAQATSTFALFTRPPPPSLTLA